MKEEGDGDSGQKAQPVEEEVPTFVSKVPSAEVAPSVGEADCENSINRKVNSRSSSEGKEGSNYDQYDSNNGGSKSNSPVSNDPVAQSLVLAAPYAPSQGYQKFNHEIEVQLSEVADVPVSFLEG